MSSLLLESDRRNFIDGLRGLLAYLGGGLCKPEEVQGFVAQFNHEIENARIAKVSDAVFLSGAEITVLSERVRGMRENGARGEAPLFLLDALDAFAHVEGEFLAPLRSEFNDR